MSFLFDLGVKVNQEARDLGVFRKIIIGAFSPEFMKDKVIEGHTDWGSNIRFEIFGDDHYYAKHIGTINIDKCKSNIFIANNRDTQKS